MNLLTEPWLPVQRASGALDWIAPHQMTEAHDPPMRLAATRPDFNGSLMQFLIGLVQTTTSVDSHAEWLDALEMPPATDTLKAQFSIAAIAFEFAESGPSFMQDLTLTPEMGEEKPIAALLIEFPGENTLKESKDHFIKRGTVSAICSHCAAAALFTLQTNAPGGGQGHRTGLRGGGPLTTLIIHTPDKSSQSVTSGLWHNVWLNVLLRKSFLAQSGDASKIAPEYSFPWLADIKKLQPGEETQPVHMHPAQMFWAMPRRIRIDLSKMEKGACDICGQESDRLVTHFHTKNYGMNYKGAWRHPLSPYYRSKSSEPFLPVHPQIGGFGYRHWLSWVIGTPHATTPHEPAVVVNRFLQDLHGSGQYRLWAFGYDVYDSNKIRCWYESTLPLYDFSSVAGSSNKLTRVAEVLQGGVGRMVDAAAEARFYVRNAIQNAWFGDAEVRGKLDFIDSAFWSSTETSFYSFLEDWIAHVRKGSDTPADTAQLREAWLRILRTAALRLYGDHAEGGQIGTTDPQRVAEAYRQLVRRLDGPKLKELMGFAKSDGSAPMGNKGVGRKKKNARTEALRP